MLCNCHKNHKAVLVIQSSLVLSLWFIAQSNIALETLRITTERAKKINTKGKSKANTDDRIAVCCCNSTDLMLVHGASVEQMTAEVDPILIPVPLDSPPATLQCPWSMLATQTSALVCQLLQQLLRSPHFQSPTASAFQMPH